MFLPSDYDKAQAYQYGSNSNRLPVGGYVCNILNVEEKPTQSGSMMVVVSYDIAEGEYAGFFRKRYEADKKDNPYGAKWRGTYTLFVCNKDGSTNGWFKGFMTNWEKSNNRPLNKNADYSQMKNTQIGLIVREEEFESQSGAIMTTTRACNSLPVEAVRLGKFELPQKRTLQSNNSSTATSSNVTASSFETTVVDDDSDLPF